MQPTNDLSPLPQPPPPNIGGTTCGSTRASPLGWRLASAPSCTRNGPCGNSLSPTCRGRRSSWMRCAPPIPSRRARAMAGTRLGPRLITVRTSLHTRSSDVCSALSYKKEEAEEASINHNEGLPRTWHRRLVERVPRATPRRPDVFRAPTHSWRFGRTSTAHRPAMTRRHSPTLPNHAGADCARRGGGAGL